VDRVAKDADAVNIGLGAVGYNSDISYPVKAVIDVYPKVSEVGYHSDMVGT